MEVSNLVLCMSWTSNAKKSRVTQRSSEIAWDCGDTLIQCSAAVSGTSDIIAGRRCSVIELDVKGRDLCLFLSGFVTDTASQWRKMNEHWIETVSEEGRELSLCDSLIWYGYGSCKSVHSVWSLGQKTLKHQHFCLDCAAKVNIPWYCDQPEGRGGTN